MEDKSESAPVILHGIPASAGVAVGTIRLISRRDLDLPSDLIPDEEVAGQFRKATQVLKRVEKQLRDLQKTQNKHEILEILDAEVQIVRDPELKKRVEQLILNGNRSAGFALYTAFNEYIQLLRQTGQEWVKDRIIDLQTLRDKIIDETAGTDPTVSSSKGTILFAEELTPSQLIELSESEIAAIVLQHGGTTSHTVIIAQSLGIPCVVGVDWRRTQLDKATLAAVDAGTGEVAINPDGKLIAGFRDRQATAEAEKKRAISAGRRPNKTLCGTVFNIRANIEFEEELERVREYSAEGVGLLRTETLFLRQGYFDVKEHIRLYRTVLAETGAEPVTIRLLDVGGDKLPGKKIDESNPFMGWRGVRMLLDETELLESQLEAVYSVAAGFPGRIRILLPMVTDASEVREIRKSTVRVQKKLEEKGITIQDPVPVGIMIEVPAIAIQAREAAAAADFFSIGSNDLTQYILAADRGNERVVHQFRSFHPAVLKLIRIAFDAAGEAGIPINVCGEMAGKPLMAAALLGMGVRELSMNPASIPMVKKLLCSHDLHTWKKLQEALLNASDGEEADRVIEAWKKKYLNGL